MAKKRQDGEYKRESLVTVELDAFQASLFAPDKLKDVESRTPGILAQARDDVVSEQYIVTTRCIQGTWETEFKHVDGSSITLPEKVFQRGVQQHKSIQKEKRRDAARNTLRRVAEQDQRQAAQEPSEADAPSFLGR